MILSVVVITLSTFLTRTSCFVPYPGTFIAPRFSQQVVRLKRLTAATRTVEAPTREQTDRKTGSGSRTGKDKYDDTNDDDEDMDYADMEYLMDPYALRGDEDPFHILLMGSTFDKPKVTVSYVSTALDYVLGMPATEGMELSKFAKEEGMACLGTWKHKECIELGKQLQVRDIVCRVVPFAEGGQRGWQAKDALSNNAAGAGSS